MPHWPNGSEAEPAPEGHEYLVDQDGLIIGMASKPAYMSEDQLAGLMGIDASKTTIEMWTTERGTDDLKSENES